VRTILTYGLALLLTLEFTIACGQVDKIKGSSSANTKSSSSRSSGGEGGSSSGSGFFAYLFIDLIGNGFVQWQQQKLSRKEINPRIVSLEIPLQIAVQPSNYYLMNPRIRGNWGLISTDFRLNYLIEEDIDGPKDLTTFDWQVIQLNLITAKNAIGRVGFGSMKENFGSNQSFFESTMALSIFSSDHDLDGNLEYRVAKDWETDSTPRREVSLSVEKRLFSKGAFHGFASLGGVYQRYYSSVTVWGVQAGIVFRFHRPINVPQQDDFVN
jgi:hypothetical protein